MHDTEFPEDIEFPDDNDPPEYWAVADGDGPRPNRRRINSPERRALDQALAQRLDRLGASPWTKKVKTMVEVSTGKTFWDVSPRIEHWLFAGPAKQRAATFNAIFSAFHAQADTYGFRGYVLRTPFEKVPLGGLAKAIKALTKRYGRVLANATRDGLAKPVAVFVHPRLDTELNVWDLHLHCIADVIEGMEDRFFLRLALNFSTPKSIYEIENMAAWANYSSAWVLDHRDIKNWPDAAVLEFWNLKAPQLIRKAGDLAIFARAIKGKALGWKGDRVVIADKEPRQKRQDGRGHPLRSSQQVAYAEVRIGGRRRRCAIFSYDRQEARRSAWRREPSRPAVTPSRAWKKTPTTTGSIPSTPIRGHSALRDARRLRRRIALWETIWPWGTLEHPPGPIRRRLERSGVVVTKSRQRRAGTGRQRSG